MATDEPTSNDRNLVDLANDYADFFEEVRNIAVNLIDEAKVGVDHANNSGASTAEVDALRLEIARKLADAMRGLVEKFQERQKNGK